MRSSSLGKRESGEMESHHQDANLTEADKARRSSSNLRSPISFNIPTVTNEGWRRVGNDLFISYPATWMRDYGSSVTGRVKSLQFHQLVSSLVRQVKVSDRGLSQWINCYASNAGTSNLSPRGRQADSQCDCWGRVAVVIRDGERPSQGEGPQPRRGL
jgi:hypothetical protein